MPTDNGCTCEDVRALGEMPPGWKCVACRARAASSSKCKLCGVGLYDHEEARGDLCTDCSYANSDPVL